MDDFLELIYTSVVKGKLSNLPKSNKYNLNDTSNLKLINRIDNVISNFIKCIIFVIIVSLFLKFNIYSIIIGSIGYIFYKKYVNIDAIKENFKSNSLNIKCKIDEILNDSAKLKLKGLLIIFILFKFSIYKKIYMTIFVGLFIFTIKDIYSNIKTRTSFLLKDYEK